jgi:hypothetical protein
MLADLVSRERGARVWFLVLITGFLVFACVLVPLFALAAVMLLDRRRASRADAPRRGCGGERISTNLV